MDITNFITSGSTDAAGDLKWSGLDHAPLGGILMMPGGNVKLLLGNPTDSDEELDIEEWSQVSSCLGYLMFALNKKDWMLEYVTYEKELETVLESGLQEMERSRMRAHLRVIDGGKTDADAEPASEVPSESE